MSAPLHELADRAGLPVKVMQTTLSRLVVEALDAQEREEHRRLGEDENFEPVTRLDAQREKREEARGKYRHTCEVCGNRFTADRRHARFCSNACQMRAYRKRKARSSPTRQSERVAAGLVAPRRAS